MQTVQEYRQQRNNLLIGSFVIILILGGGVWTWNKLNTTPTYYGGGTLTSYTEILKKGQDYQTEDGKIQNLPDTEYLGYFTYLKEGFNEHTISVSSDNTPKTIQKHVYYDTDTDTVNNTYTTDGITIDTNYKTTKTKNKSLGAPTPQIKQTFTLTNTTNQNKIITFTSRTTLDTNTVEYNGRTITITETPITLKAEEKTASIPEFAQEIGQENLEDIENFQNYQHTYRTPAHLTFETDEGTAVYSWQDAKHLNHTVTLYEQNNEFLLSFTVDDITIEPNSSFTIDPAYGLDQYQNYDVRYDGQVEIEDLTKEGIVVVEDVNGDTYPDLIVGTPHTHYNGEYSGSIFISFGTSTIATGTVPLNITSHFNVRFDGPFSNGVLVDDSEFALGDVNGDGFSDLVIGAPYTSSGSIYVIFSTLIDSVGNTVGNTMPLSTSESYNIRYDGGVGDSFAYGGGFITIGDVNGDSSDDLIVSARSANNGGSGSTWVMLSTLIDDVGTTTGNDLSLYVGSNYNIRYDGAGASDNLGSALSSGDVNGDNFADLILGAFYADNNGDDSGSIYVIFSTLIDDIGSTTGNNKSLSVGTNYNIRHDGATTSDYIGGNITTGDISGDGLGDLIMSASSADNNGDNSGSTYVLFSTLIDDVGTTTGNNMPLSTNSNYNIRYDGATTSDQIGSRIILSEDVNGDSLGDLVFTSINADNNGMNTGSVYVMFSTLIDDVGTTTGNDKPLSTSTNYNIRYDGAAEYDNVGYYVRADDVNGDSQNDLMFGVSNADNNGGSSGSAYVMFSTLIDDVGTTTGNNKPLSTGTNYNVRYDGALSGDYLCAYGAITSGDVNSDGLKDLVLGAYGADNNGDSSGSAYVLYSTLIDDVGATTGNNKSLATSTNFTSRFDGGANMIENLSSDGEILIGDVNGDGVGDLVLGAPYSNYVGTRSGSVYLIFGGATTTNAASLHVSSYYNIRYDGSASYDYLSRYGTFTIGDVNGDGLGDLVLGAADADNNGSSSGSAYIIFSTLIDDVGATKGNIKRLASSSSYNIRYDGGVGHYLSRTPPRAGDVNGDGLGDLVLATTEGDPYGYVMVVFSTLVDDVGASTGNIRTATTSSHYNVMLDGYGGCVPDNCHYGSGVEIGDVNGDGLGDLVTADDTTYGNIWIQFSTKIDNVGTTTGNNWYMFTGTSYNLRYNPNVDFNYFGNDLNFALGDVNGDGLGDLVVGARGAGNNGANSGSVWVMFSTLIDNVGESTGNQHWLTTSSRYNIRYDGGAASEELSEYAALAIGDVNGDGLEDLVMGANEADNNGNNTGSVYIVFSTLIDDVGASTGNVKPLSTATNYNIRYDGAELSDWITRSGSLDIGDVNGDGLGDLLIGAPWADNGGSGAGSLYVILSTHIDDVGMTTGNVKPLSTSTNYNLRYDGGATSDLLTYNNAIAIGDINSDGISDLVIGASGADNNGPSGSVWIIHAQPPPKYKMKGSVQIQGYAEFR